MGALLRGLGLFDCPGQLVEKGGVVGLVDVVDVPESRLSNLLTRRGITQPPIRPGVGRGFTVVAYERNGVPFEVCPFAPGAWLVVDVHPEEGKLAELVADTSFHLEFLNAKVSLSTAAVAPLGVIVMEVVTFDHCLPDALPEDRASVIAASSYEALRAPRWIRRRFHREVPLPSETACVPTRVRRNWSVSTRCSSVAKKIRHRSGQSM